MTHVRSFIRRAAFTSGMIVVISVQLSCQGGASPTASGSSSLSASPASSPSSTSPQPAPASASPASSAPALAADGYPTGQDTPEGAACDLARAFITADSALWRRVCYSSSHLPEGYSAFLTQMAAQMDQVKAMPAGSAGGPSSISKLYKARPLSNSSGSSFGFAVMRFDEVMFVDVVTPVPEHPDYTNRTLLVQREDDHHWYVIPRPDLFPLLCPGLNEESDSTELWKSPAKP